MIDDLIACGRGLQALEYTSADRTVLSAESADGTIVVVAVKQDPELRKSVIMERPFVDLITVLSLTILRHRTILKC